MIGVVWIVFVSVFLALIVEKKTEEVIPVVFISVMVFLFPFYCLNILKAGRLALYAIPFILAVVSVVNRNIKRIPEMISPGLIVFCITCFLVFLVTKDNFVWLWDETRLWCTEKLQLGKKAIVFPVMQSYPPGMPLVVYFIESFNSVFKEWEIYYVYGVFYCSLVIPSLKGLKFEKSYLIPVLALIIFLFPCLISAHGGDFCYYYNSLFIDVFLGSMIGYGLYNAVSDCLNSKWNKYRFIVTLAGIVLLKDTGILFAVCVFLVAVLSDRERNNKRLFYTVSFLILVGVNRWWGLLLKHYGIINDVGLKNTLTKEVFESLRIKSLTETVLLFHEYGNVGIHFNVELPFIIVILLGIFVSFIIQRYYQDIDVKSNAYVVLVYLFTTIVFMIGFGMAYGVALNSYQRYVSTIVMGLLLFVLLRLIVIITNRFSLKNNGVTITVCKAVCLLSLVGVLIVRVNNWEMITDQDRHCPYEKSVIHTNKIVNTIGVNDDLKDLNLYILYAGNPAANCILEQRIYMNLMGTGITIKNYYKDMEIVGSTVYDTINVDELYELADQWKEKIMADYDYIYVVQSNEKTNEAFKYLENEELIVNSIYKVDKLNNRIARIS